VADAALREHFLSDPVPRRVTNTSQEET
jgi:hypothetical protein